MGDQQFWQNSHSNLLEVFNIGQKEGKKGYTNHPFADSTDYVLIVALKENTLHVIT